MTQQEIKQVVIRFQQTGGAQPLKQNRVKIKVTDKLSKVVSHLQNRLKDQSVFIYLKEAFVPQLNEQIGNLFQIYGVKDELVVNYALQPVWG